MDGGDLGGGESEGRVGAICVKFPQPLAFFGFSPHNFLIRAKMHKPKKRPKVEDMTPFSRILCVTTRQEDLLGEVGVVGFLLGGQEENLKIGFENLHFFLSEIPQN